MENNLNQIDSQFVDQHVQVDQFEQAIQQFNQGDYYACHDTLEAIWIEAPEPERNFYQGLLQIAVGIYHLSNLNWRGALILLGEGINRLQPYEPVHAGIEIESIVDRSAELLAALQRAGADGMAAIVTHLNLAHPTNLPVSVPQEFLSLCLPRIVQVEMPESRAQT
jgi:predicted metal-dependent hydrolase